MFEKESKEYANNWLNHVKDLELRHKTDEKPEYIRILEAHQKGAEYGYNLAHEEMDYLNKHWENGKDKVNEWHYVKDELPIGKPYQNGTKAFVTVAYINHYNFPKKLDCYYWNNEFLCDSICGYKKVEDVCGKVYAWKYEDKLPEIPKENE